MLTTAKPTITPVAGSMLQRTCACGQHTAGSGGECEECKKKREGKLQRAVLNDWPTHERIESPNQTLSSSASIFRNPSLEHDFSRIPTFSSSGREIQTKLAINKPGDEYEQEADRIADQAMSPPPLQSSVTTRLTRIQRFMGKPNGQLDAAPASVDQALASPGMPLGPALRQDMEQRFGYDFSQVRVHSSAVAEQSALDVNAHAYTVGQDMVFGSGRFAPGTHEGRRLLAHELTHVVQQGSAPHPARIFRAAIDFRIRGKFPAAASLPSFVYFDEGSSTFDAAEKAKIAAFALPASDMLTLNGFSSEEGSAAANLPIVNARLGAVAAELVAKGHDPAKITKVPLPTSGKGRIDYRRMRSVEILGPGAPSSVPSAAAATTAPCAGSNETAFVDAEGEAEAMIDKAVTALSPPIPAAMTALLTRLFPGWAPADAATIKSNLSDIKTQLHRLLPAANHRCAIIKYAACEVGTEAQNMGPGATAMMTMCPTFFDAAKSKKNRGGTLLHEASHGTPGLTTADKAYKHERLIEFLSLADALQNSDSYTLLVRLFDVPGSMTVGPATSDPLGGGIMPSSPEEKAARRTIAWMEKWLIWSYQEMSNLYDTIVRSRPAGAWSNLYYKDTMGLVAPLFGLTAPTALPTKADQVKVAAIHDRFHIMRATEWSTAVTLNKTAAPTDTWAPGPGTSVDLSPAFFADSPRGQLDRLLTAIAKATPDVSAAFVPKYVTLADKIRTHMSEGGP